MSWKYLILLHYFSKLTLKHLSRDNLHLESMWTYFVVLVKDILVNYPA